MLSVVDASVEWAFFDPAHPLVTKMAHLAELKVVWLNVLGDSFDLIEAYLASSMWSLDEAKFKDLDFLVAAVRAHCP